MERVFYFSSKPIRVCRIITLICVIAAFTLLLIFVFSTPLLIISCLLIPVAAFMLLTLNRSKIMIKGDQFVLVNIITWSWQKSEIKSITCNRNLRGWLNGCIEIHTDQKTIRSPGYQFLNWSNADKNEKLVEKLNRWLKAPY